MLKGRKRYIELLSEFKPDVSKSSYNHQMSWKVVVTSSINGSRLWSYKPGPNLPVVMNSIITIRSTTVSANK